MSMTGTTPAPPAGRTAPAPTGRNWWLIVLIGIAAVVAIVAIALWLKSTFLNPPAPVGDAQTITATVPATVPKGSDLPRGTKLEGGELVAINGGMITATTGAKGVEKDGLKLSVSRDGDMIVATLKSATGGKLAVDVSAAGLNGVFPTTYWNVERPQSPADALVVEIPLGKGEQSVTLYWGKL